MNNRKFLALLASGLLFSTLVSAGEYNPFALPANAIGDETTYRLIVKWRNAPAGVAAKAAPASSRAAKLSAETGIRMKYSSEIATGLEVLELEQPVSASELPRVLAAVRENPGVEFADPDVWRRPHRVPSDSLFAGQWFLDEQEISATRAIDAWDLTVGSSGTVVAILDTGVRYSHPDLGAASVQGPGKSLPGFDFVSSDPGGSFLVANDGNARDASPSDPGDWVDANDLQQPAFSNRNCTVGNSSWHGTRVSGIVGALSDNGIGVTGMSWNTLLLPVRVLGKCGGFDSDILPAMRWAAGLTVSGVPNNPFPANVINLSLGSDGPCTSAAQAAINEVIARGVVVVVSAGNDGGMVDAPANCQGVVAVGAIRHIGTKVGFSNVGPGVTISAPGGNCVNTAPGQPCLFSIDTTVNVGATVAAGSSYTNQQNFNVGTSFSAPIVAGTVALMHSVNARLTPDRVMARLRESARGFPTSSNSPASAGCPLPVPTCHVPTSSADIQTCECICTISTCGAGMLDTQASVAAALRPAAAIAAPSSVVAGSPVSLDGSGSAASCNRSITAYAWSVAPGSPQSPGITNPGQAQASVTAPTTGFFVVRLTVTDDVGATDFTDVTVRTTTTTAGALLPGSACPVAVALPQAPASDDAVSPAVPPPGGGGGGALAAELLLLFGLLGARRLRSQCQEQGVVNPGTPVARSAGAREFHHRGT